MFTNFLNNLSASEKTNYINGLSSNELLEYEIYLSIERFNFNLFTKTLLMQIKNKVISKKFDFNKVTDNDYNELFNDAKKYANAINSFFVIIDEIGYLPIDKDSSYGFFQLIAARYENRSTILTTNQPFSKWGDVFGDVVIANAIIDRLVHHCEIIKITGMSYRIKGKSIFEEET